MEWVTTYGRRLHPYPIWYNLFGATPLTTEGSPWVWVEMDNGKVITGRVIDFGLDDPDAGSLVLVMVTMIVGDNAMRNVPVTNVGIFPKKAFGA